MQPITRRRIDIIALAGVQVLDVTGPFQVFATANDLRAEGGLPAVYEIHAISPQDGLVRSSSGLEFATKAPPRGRPDTLIVAGGIGMRAAARDETVVRWLTAIVARARRVASVCTGAFLLAATGALDGRRVTTHWAHCTALATRHPSLQVDPDPIYIRDGDVWTSAGVTAGIDLALALVEDDLGAAMALNVARHLVMFVKRPGGQAQFSDALSQQSEVTRFDALIGWIEGNLQHDLSVPTLAAQAGMSERSFLRHWRNATGSTPARTVERLRVEAARHALGTTRHSLKRIATRCGFGTAETMRRSFQKLLSVSPQDWRERFKATA